MKRKVQALFFIVAEVVIFVYLLPNSVLATTPCYFLPKYVDEFKYRYENVEIGKDDCRPNYSFKTPASYSKFTVSYKVNFSDYLTAKSIEEYDMQLRSRIEKGENCPNVAKYLELSKNLQIPGYPFSDISLNYFLDSSGEACVNLSGTIDYLENEKIIVNFLNSQKKFGDYTVCKQDSNGGRNYDHITFYVICDNHVKESIRLVVKENVLLEAFFQNSESEVYRKIYPEDVIIRGRSPAWEQQEKIELAIKVIVGVLIVTIAVIIIIIRKKSFTRRK